MKKLFIFLSFISVLFIFQNCGSNASTMEMRQKAVGENVEAVKFKELVAKNDGILLDVRTPEEVAEGHLKNAIFINFNDDDFEKKVTDLQKGKPVYVYCRSGRRSAAAAEIMHKNGFSKVYNLSGGINAWSEKGFEIVKTENNNK